MTQLIKKKNYNIKEEKEYLSLDLLCSNPFQLFIDTQ